jgi:hypothetical protein
MNPTELQRQLTLISLLIEGAESDPAFRSDLPVAACKIRLLISRLAPDHAQTSPHLSSRLHELLARWSRAYFGTESADPPSPSFQPSTGPAAAHSIRLPWTPEEERHSLSLLESDLGMFLFMKFGRVNREALGVDGRWRLVISNEQVFDAHQLRSSTTAKNIEGLAARALLIRAATGLPRRSLLALAESITPATFELFVTDDPREVITRIAEGLCASGHLHEFQKPRSEVMFHLTPKGQQDFERALLAWQHARIPLDPPVNDPHPPLGDDIPF